MKKEDFKIRKARKEDLEELWKIEKESREFHTEITGKEFSSLNKSKVDDQARRKWIKEFKLDNKNTICLVAELEEGVVGYVVGEIGRWKWSDNPPKTLWLEDIGVLRKFHRKGIADQLVKEIEKKARKEGVKFSYLTVWLKNKPAYNLYLKNNYSDFSINMMKRLR